jgi:hypothetical protein
MISPLRSNRRRGAFSLVELVGVMIAGSVVVGVAIAAMVGAMRADRRLAESGDDQRAAGQLAEQLRRDIHAADDAQWNDSTGALTLRQPDGDEIIFTLTSRGLERREATVDGGDARLAGAYALPRGARIIVEPAEAERGQLMTIGWSGTRPRRSDGGLGRRPFEVVATVGRDLQLLHP